MAEERNKLLGDKRAINSATKAANGNLNLNGQPIVIVIFANGRTLIAQHLYLDALMLGLAERKCHGRSAA